MSLPDNQSPAAPLSANAVRFAAEYGPNPILELDATGAVRSANPAAIAELHYEATQLPGHLFLDLLDEGSREKGQTMLDAAARGPTEVFELTQMAGDGTFVMVGYRAVPLPGQHPDGEPSGTLLIGRLLSTTVAATERLIALNRRLNALFTIASVASRSLVITAMLDEVLELALSELDAQAGAVLLRLAPVEGSLAHAASPEPPAPLRLAVEHGFAPNVAAALPGRLALTDEAHEQLARGKPFVLYGRVADIGLDPTDLLAPVGPLLSLVAVPLRSERQLLGWLFAVSDRYHAFEASDLELIGSIGDLLGPPIGNARLHGALLETSGQLGAVLDTIDSGVLLIDDGGIVRYANARLGHLLSLDVAGWPGRPRDQLIGQLLTPVDQPSTLFYGELWATTGKPARLLRRFTERIADASGVTTGTIEVYSDVTEIHNMDRFKDEFVAAAAHDLKTPVTAVKGYTQIAMRLARKSGDARLLQQLEMINARSDDLTYLIDTLLDMSRLQAGRLYLDIEPLALADLVARVVRHFDFDLRRQGRVLALDLPVAPVTVEWDGMRIERALFNLIGNALKYSPNGGVVELRARLLLQAGGELVELAVTDHGIGIPPAERELIFERFHRAPQAIADGFKGSGLGLYICRSVIEAHGGQIWAADALHGGPGTTIFALLPRRVAGS
jgi:two-component system, OmpR family, phosphate regulon sensor histidine kinase PhoR